MPIDHIEIKSFKSIVSQSVGLGALNVFIGTNGAGKSNFLEAVGILSSAIEGELSYTSFAERGVRLSTPAVFKTSFRHVARKTSFSLDAKLGELQYHVNISPSGAQGFEYSAEKLTKSGGHTGRSNRGQTLSFDKKAKHDKALTRSEGMLPLVRLLNEFDEVEVQNLNDAANYAIYSLSTPILRGVSPDGSHKEPLGLYGGSLATALADVISEYHGKSEKKIMEIQRFFRLINLFKTIGTTNNVSSELQSSHVHTSSTVVRYVDKYMKTNFNTLYAYDVSEGALYILFVLVLLLHKKSPNMFALDNVDNALNPGLVRSLMSHVAEILEQNPQKQAFITTHNPTTLDSIDLFNASHRLFVVSRNEDGHTEIRRISPPKGFTRNQWVEKYKGMRLSEIWLSGLLGGLPDDEI